MWVEFDDGFERQQHKRKVVVVKVVCPFQIDVIRLPA